MDAIAFEALVASAARYAGISDHGTAAADQAKTGQSAFGEAFQMRGVSEKTSELIDPAHQKTSTHAEHAHQIRSILSSGLDEFTEFTSRRATLWDEIYQLHSRTIPDLVVGFALKTASAVVSSWMNVPAADDAETVIRAKVRRDLTPDLGHADSSRMLGKREFKGWQGRTTPMSFVAERLTCMNRRLARR